MRMSKSYILTSHSIYTGAERISFKLFLKKLKNLPRRFCKDSKFFTLTSNPGAMSFLGQDVVNHSVFQGFLAGHPEIPVGVGKYLFVTLPAML